MWWMLMAKKGTERAKKVGDQLNRKATAARGQYAQSQAALGRQQDEALSYEPEPDSDSDDFSDEKRRKARAKGQIVGGY